MPVFALSPIDLRVDSWSTCIEKKRRWFATHKRVIWKTLVVSKKLPKTPKLGRFPNFSRRLIQKTLLWRCWECGNSTFSVETFNLQSWNMSKIRWQCHTKLWAIALRHFSTPNRITETTKAVYLQAVFRKCVRKKNSSTQLVCTLYLIYLSVDKDASRATTCHRLNIIGPMETANHSWTNTNMEYHSLGLNLFADLRVVSANLLP